VNDDQIEFLESRGYTPLDIHSEEVFGIPKTGTFQLEGRMIRDCEGCIAWLARSMSGAPVGVQTREIREHKYRWHQLDNVEHLPMLYGTMDDWDLVWHTGSMYLTEGPFDRIAVKRALPDRAVFARLSKGISNQMLTLIKRYVKHLWLAFDSDEEGDKAAHRSEMLLGEGLNVYRLRFPFKDPSEMMKKRGLSALRGHMEKQMRMASIE